MISMVVFLAMPRIKLRTSLIFMTISSERDCAYPCS